VTSSNPVDLGWLAVRTRSLMVVAVGELLGGCHTSGLGGHGESLRRSRDDAAGVKPGCAARRSVVFPMQSGGTRRNVLESDGLPQLERVLRDESMPEKRRPCPGVGSGAPRDSCNMVKARLPESQSPEDATIHPPEKRPKPAPRPAAASPGGRRNLRDAERCLMKTLKEMSGAPKLR